MGNTGQLKGLMRAKCHSYYLICDTRCKHTFLQTTLLQLIQVEKVAIAALKTSKLQRWAERYDIKCNAAKLLLWILDTPLNFFWGSCQSISVHQSWSQVFTDDDVCINYVCRGSSHGNNYCFCSAKGFSKVFIYFWPSNSCTQSSRHQLTLSTQVINQLSISQHYCSAYHPESQRTLRRFDQTRSKDTVLSLIKTGNRRFILLLNGR